MSKIHHWLDEQITAFTAPDERDAGVRAACEGGGPWADAAMIGRSEAGRPLLGVRLGRGPVRVSLVAGAHADEPVGAETIYWLIRYCLKNRRDPAVRSLLENVTLIMLPHINPDGEAANWSWIERFPDFAAYASGVKRELPGRDVEFGYPAMRGENKTAVAFWQAQSPIDLHFSLHGMSVAEGAMLLIERSSVDETSELREVYREALVEAGVGLHDHDRGGEKGFDYLGAGFQTTPEGRRMAAYFREQGDDVMAGQFHLSSMEYLRELNGKCRCFVTEIPLWRITSGPEEAVAGEARNYQAFRRAAGRGGPGAGGTAAEIEAEYGLVPISITTAMKLQLLAIDLAIDLVIQARSG
jgi:hypothetical protein